MDTSIFTLRHERTTYNSVPQQQCRRLTTSHQLREIWAYGHANNVEGHVETNDGDFVATILGICIIIQWKSFLQEFQSARVPGSRKSNQEQSHD